MNDCGGVPGPGVGGGGVVYIVADNRSGSTLLDQLLGAHTQIRSLGEVHQLPAYASGDRSLYDPVHALNCSCGLALADCGFWSAVRERLGRPFETLTLKPRLFDRRHGRLSVGRYARRFLERRINAEPIRVTRRGYRLALGARQLGADSHALFDAILAVDPARYVVDSSKSAIRMRYLLDAAPAGRVRVLMLARDYRGVAHSKMRRGHALEQSVLTWAARMRQMETLTADIDASLLHRMRYEDLCADSASALGGVCAFLGLDAEPGMLARPASDVHHIGGSPSKFDPARREIRMDDAYRSAFTDAQLARMREIAGPLADAWGY